MGKSSASVTDSRQWIPGGCLAEDDCASLPCEGREVSVHEFEILVHSNLDRR